MTDTWTFNSDGSADFTGTVRFPAGTNLASGAGIVIFGPNGGVANFPAIFQGESGLPPTINWTIQQVAYGTALPSPNPAVTVVDAGGPGVASILDVTIYLNAGEPGESGTTTILTATDLEGTAQAGYTIGYSAADSKAQWQPKLAGNWYRASSIGATTSNTNTSKTLASIAIPAQPFNWWPEVYAQAQVVGASDTRVDLVARVNSNTGNICGYGYGMAGAAPPPVIAIPSGLAVSSNTIISAGSAATIFLNAENQTDSANAWNTTTSASFQVKAGPVPS